MQLSDNSKRCKRFFHNREIIFRTKHGFSTVVLSARTQVVVLVAFIVFVSWCVFATTSYIRHNHIISEKHRQIENLSGSYDLALQEKEALTHKISSLKKTVSDLKKAEAILFERVEALASAEIEGLHKTLADISPILQSSELTVDSLIDELKSEVEEGQGGPFIPLDGVVLPDEELDVSYQSLSGNLTKWEELTELVRELPLGKPLKNYRITSMYGVRSDPFTRKKGVHKGLDMGAKMGELVYATAGGKVTRASVNGLYGNMVEIKHKFGFKTRYAHLSKILVKKGDEVDVGTVIGKVGNTGRSTGPHLHYEIQINNKTFNPYSFVKAEKNVF